MKRLAFRPKLVAYLAIVVSLAGVFLISPKLLAVTQQQSDSVGVEGTIPSGAPSQGATISLPANGQTFTSLPVTVAGVCPKNLLVEVFKNNVFGGSAQCTTGSFSIQIDLFEGRNDLVAKVYDALNQSGPDSNTVTVTYNSGATQNGPRVLITSAFAKRGATPGSPLSWPLTISGGKPPFAISVDWGDKTTPDLISQPGPGDFSVSHTYNQSGVYNVVVKATDANGNSAYLPLVGVGNGPIQQTAQSNSNVTSKTQKEIVWWPLFIAFGLTALAFWLGQKHQLELIRDRLRRGERPFK